MIVFYTDYYAHQKVRFYEFFFHFDFSGIDAVVCFFQSLCENVHFFVSRYMRQIIVLATRRSSLVHVYCWFAGIFQPSILNDFQQNVLGALRSYGEAQVDRTLIRTRPWRNACPDRALFNLWDLGNHSDLWQVNCKKKKYSLKTINYLDSIL